MIMMVPVLKNNTFSNLCFTKASGGCDDAEDVAGGLSVALRQDWQSDETRTRIMLHIGDAPCHGAHFHKKKISDQFPIGDPTGLEPSEILKGFYRLNVNYYFGKISVLTNTFSYSNLF